MSRQTENNRTTGKRLKAWRKSVPLSLMQLSQLINASQSSLSDIENGKSLPSATTLTNLSLSTDLNINWLLTGIGGITKALTPDEENSAEMSPMYEDFMFMMQDSGMKRIVEKAISDFKNKDVKKTVPTGISFSDRLRQELRVN